MKRSQTRPPEKDQFTPEKRKEIEAAYARRDVDFLRQSFASNNPAVSEYAERFLEQVLEHIRSERDRNDAFQFKRKLPLSDESEADGDEGDTKTILEP